MKHPPSPVASPARHTPTAALWSGALALLWTLTPVLRWWHPYCDQQADGPGYFAWGFPLPWSEPTGVSSLEFTWQPLAFAVDVALAWLLLFLLARWLIGRLLARRPLGLRISTIAGGVLFLVMAAWLGLWISQSGIPSWNLGAEPYSAYRPYPIASAQGHHACS